LRVAEEEFAEEVVEAIVEEFLEGPGELGVFDVAGVDGGGEDVSAGDGVFEGDEEFDAGGGLARIEVDEEVFVARQLGADQIEGSH